MLLSLSEYNKLNIHPISHRFQFKDITDYWLFFVSTGVPFLNAFFQGEALNLGLQNLAQETTETSFCGVMQSIFRYLEPFKPLDATHDCDRQTDGQTNRHSLNYVARPIILGKTAVRGCIAP